MPLGSFKPVRRWTIVFINVIDCDMFFLCIVIWYVVTKMDVLLKSFLSSPCWYCVALKCLASLLNLRVLFLKIALLIATNTSLCIVLYKLWMLKHILYLGVESAKLQGWHLRCFLVFQIERCQICDYLWYILCKWTHLMPIPPHYISTSFYYRYFRQQEFDDIFSKRLCLQIDTNNYLCISSY